MTDESWLNPPPAMSLKALSPRETEILTMICDGKTNAEMAQTLWLSVKTIEKHRLRLGRHLRTNSIALQVRWAIRQGLIDPMNGDPIAGVRAAAQAAPRRYVCGRCGRTFGAVDRPGPRPHSRHDGGGRCDGDLTEHVLLPTAALMPPAAAPLVD